MQLFMESRPELDSLWDFGLISAKFVAVFLLMNGDKLIFSLFAIGLIKISLLDEIFPIFHRYSRIFLTLNLTLVYLKIAMSVNIHKMHCQHCNQRFSSKHKYRPLIGSWNLENQSNFVGCQKQAEFSSENESNFLFWLQIFNFIGYIFGKF